jgi:uncharacterized protein (DUF58 family)
MRMATTSARRSWGQWVQVLLTHDHFPDLDRKLRRLFWNPLGGLLLACLVAALCALYIHPRAWILALGLFAIVIIGVSWPWIARFGLRGQLRFGVARCREGESVTAHLEAGNPLPWAAYGVLVRQGLDLVAGLPVVPGRGHAERSWTFTPSRRGIYPLVPLELGTGFPFGVFEPTRPVTVTQELIVWPRTFPVVAVPDLEGENRLEGAVSRSKAGNSGDVLGVRPYRRGDSPRRIHWAQSARHDRLIVCELQSSARPMVLIALDDEPSHHRGESREWAIRVCASLCESWLEQGAEIALWLRGHVIGPAAGQQHRQRLLDALARLPDEPGTAFDPHHAGWQAFQGTRVLVGTEHTADDRLARRILLCASAFEDPSGAATAPPSNTWIWIHDPARVPVLARQGGKA